MKYKFGSDFFLDEIAMSMKEEENNIEVIEIIDDDVDDGGNKIQ